MVITVSYRDTLVRLVYHIIVALSSSGFDGVLAGWLTFCVLVLIEHD